MVRRHPRAWSLVALTVATLLILLVALVARLAAQAEGGEIVLSEETRARLGADVGPEDIGLRELKGVERPVRLYRLR